VKVLIGAIIGLIGSVIIIMLDIKFVHYLFSLLPASEWTGIAKVVVVFIDIWATLGLCVMPFILGLGIGATLEKNGF
jgi:hypothetical protein